MGLGSTYTLALTMGLTAVCLLTALSWRSSTVRSDCLEQGSSSTVRPRLSDLASGRATCNKPGGVKYNWKGESKYYNVILCDSWLNCLVYIPQPHYCVVYLLLVEFITLSITTKCHGNPKLLYTCICTCTSYTIILSLYYIHIELSKSYQWIHFTGM